MKTKITKDIISPEKKVIMKTTEGPVDFTIDKKGVCTIEGCSTPIPIRVLVKHAIFGTNTKPELIKAGYLNEDGTVAEAYTKQAQDAAKEEPKAEAPKAEPKKEASAAKPSAGGIAVALHNLNGICKFGIKSLVFHKIDDESIEGSLVFISTKVPAINFSIVAADFATDRFEKDIEQWIEDHSATITNSLEVIKGLEEQIKSLTAAAAAKKEEKTAKSEPAAKSTTKTTTKAAPKNEEPKKEEKDLFAAKAEEEESFDEGEETADLDEEVPGVDDEKFEE